MSLSSESGTRIDEESELSPGSGPRQSHEIELVKLWVGLSRGPRLQWIAHSFQASSSDHGCKCLSGQPRTQRLRPVPCDFIHFLDLNTHFVAIRRHGRPSSIFLQLVLLWSASFLTNVTTKHLRAGALAPLTMAAAIHVAYMQSLHQKNFRTTLPHSLEEKNSIVFHTPSTHNQTCLVLVLPVTSSVCLYVPFELYRPFFISARDEYPNSPQPWPPEKPSRISSFSSRTERFKLHWTEFCSTFRESVLKCAFIINLNLSDDH